MAFIKVVKNKAYYKRYQVKFRRRRECRTDYYARKRLIIQDKNKYKTPKYRFVVRFTNKDITCQVFMADLEYDVCIASAYAHELSRYGVKTGLTNYAAAYCTGLLLARRINKKFNLDFEGNVDEDANLGEDYNVEADYESASPFCALLDVGLKRTTTGSRIFGALKGMCDGGVDVPHNDRRFPGSVLGSNKKVEANPDMHRDYIFGQHVARYMEQLAEEGTGPDSRYRKQFSAYIKAGVEADSMEDMYAKAHAAIRADPNLKRSDTELGRFKVRAGAKTAPVKKRWSRAKTSLKQRKDRIRQKLTHMQIPCLANEL